VTPAVRILWLTKGLGLGGAERLLVNTATRIDQQRFEVDVAYLLPHKDALVEDLSEAGLSVHCLAQSRPFDTRWVGRLRTLARKRRYSIVHTHMPIPAAAARVVLPPKAALVHTEHNVWQRYRRPTYWANAITYARNDHVVAVSQSVAESIRPDHVPGWRRHAPALEVVHHGPVMERDEAPDRREARRRLGVPDGCPVIGTVGNLTPKKDHATLLRAFALVVDDLPQARLVLVGGGPAEAATRRLVRELRLEGSVILTGTRDDVPMLLPGLDVFCLTSRFEGLSIAMLEAMAVGVPPVVTTVGGLPEAVRHEIDGLLTPPGDAVATAAALRRLVRDNSLSRRLGAAARTRAQTFDLDKAVRRLEEIYVSVLELR
jgi:glycosyltransferase involved in cell wall biosynthesis